MTETLVLNLILATIFIVILIYTLLMFKYYKTDGEYSLLALIFFWKPIESNSTQSSSHKIKQKRNAGVSEIERLEQKLFETDDVDERQSLLDQIRRLQNG